MSVINIEDVSTFINHISKIHKPDNTELFFRGQADSSWPAEPGIFRNKKLLNNEKNLFNDIITQCPEDFKDCQFTFEYLVKMQHYSLPTRLLDITSNPLVALYFACYSLNDFMYDENGNKLYEQMNSKDDKGFIYKEKDQRKDGKIFVYQVYQNQIRNYNSDTVSVLSNLAHLDINFNLMTVNMKELLEELQWLNKILTEHLEHFITESNKDREPSSCLKTAQLSLSEWLEVKLELEQYGQSDEIDIIERMRRLIEIVQPDGKEKIKNLSPLVKNKIQDLQRLQEQKRRYFHFIKQEKSYFVDNINTQNDVQKIVCVRAKMNNPRIIRQSGLFFLFGMGKTKGDSINLLELKKDQDAKQDIQQLDHVECIIPGDKKETILQELQSLGISEQTLMPEIDIVAKSIKDRYSRKE